MLRIGDLKVARHQYQRRLNKAKVNKIVAEWDPHRAIPPRVSRRSDGIDYIIDGQHTVQAMIELFGPDHRTLCIVYERLTAKREGDIYRQQHKNQTRLSTFEQYKADLFCGDRTTAEIDSIVRDAGLQVGNFRAGNAVSAIRALKQVHTHYRNLTATLLVLTKWGAGKGTYDGKILMSVGCLLHRYPKLKMSRLIDKLNTTTPKQLVTQIQVKSETDRLRSEICGALILRAMYNERLKTKLPRFGEDD